MCWMSMISALTSSSAYRVWRAPSSWITRCSNSSASSPKRMSPRSSWSSRRLLKWSLTAYYSSSLRLPTASLRSFHESMTALKMELASAVPRAPRILHLTLSFPNPISLLLYPTTNTRYLYRGVFNSLKNSIFWFWQTPYFCSQWRTRLTKPEPTELRQPI